MKVKKSLTSTQAVRLLKKFGVVTTKEHILKNFKNGDFLFRKKNTDTGVVIDYFLHEIYFKSFVLRYNANPKSKSGKELLISNFELPRGKVVL